MKKLLSYLTLLLFLGFIAAILYVMDILPFQKNNIEGTVNSQVTSQTKALPDFLSEQKISRAKTYSEYINHGMLLEKNGFESLAIADYQQANKLQPNYPEPFIKIGRIHLRNRKYDNAQVNFEEALKMDPVNVDGQVYLGRSLMEQRKLEEARNILDKINSDTQSVKYYQGIVAAYFGNYEASKQFFKRAIELNTTENLTKKSQNFLNAYKEADFNQGTPKAHLKTLLARSCNQTGEYQVAIALLFDVIKEQKNYRDAWILMGYAYLNIEKHQDAIEALEQARKLDPQKAETLFFLGLSYYGKNDLRQAASLLEIAKNNGFQPVIQIEQKLAEIYLELKQYDKSAKNYERVVTLNDNDINYYIRPMWLYIEKLNQPEIALRLAEKAVKNHSSQAMGYNLLGWAQIETGNLYEAEKNLQKALALNPQLDAIYFNLGKLLEKRGDPIKALELYSKAYEMGNNNSISAAAIERYNNIIAKNKNLNQAALKASTIK